MIPDFLVGNSPVKTGIIWHFTAGGTLSGARATLAKLDKVNVLCMIDKDGTRHMLMEEDQWAYHTGMGKSWCSVTFGVEFVNWGPLTFEKGLYLPWTKSTRHAVPEDKVAPCAFRGYRFYERLTLEQRQSALELSLDLQTRHPLVFEKTHADINPKKLDFPPDFPGLNEFMVLSIVTGWIYHTQ